MELPEDRVQAEFDDESTLVLTPDMVGAGETLNSGIIGEQVDLTFKHLGDVRPSQVVYELRSYLVLNKWRFQAEMRRWRSDFIVRVDDGHGDGDLLASHGCWAFAEFTDVYAMQQDFAAHVEQAFDRLTG